MATATVNPRHTKPLCCALDPDANALLRVMVPNGRGIGLLLSELIRKEARERTQRPALLQALQDASAAGQTGHE